MLLPIFTSEDDVEIIVNYLKTKVKGATIADAKATLKKKILDPRKIRAYRTWGIISKEGENIKLTPLGQELGRAAETNKPAIYAQILRKIKPYFSVLEWIYHQNLDKVTNVEVATHWDEHYKSYLGTANETAIKDMAVCFFRLTQAAGLGQLVMGWGEKLTHVEIFKEAVQQFIEGGVKIEEEPEEAQPLVEEEKREPLEPEPSRPPRKLRVFISHGKNMNIVAKVKEILDLVDFDYEIAVEEETTAIPVPDKVFSAMRRCDAAVICVTADEKEKRTDEKSGEEFYGVNENVLIEIGAAFVLYEKKVVLVWDTRVKVPSNLGGLYRCEFSGDELSWDAGTKLMKAAKKFKEQAFDFTKLEE
ncbi:hypothetical protein CEE36_04190 [candidate division TA06 bacterium B3_TA06]|uniref:CD-NTase-associated protein 12/Pycsar effector protein TIR domain-containing protein n=1 Tax=candidate division TA06 bacterium B3_TA06 TaxID=2012487 RepID=A0A532V7S2_UNCT6|nr:MAG: hypothetical protein CEE36_04190 [candidate division TA06 bacterium B3_TA06]